MAPGNSADRPDYYFNLGVASYRNGNPEDALAALSSAISLDPGIPEAFFYQGVILADTGRYEEALHSMADLPGVIDVRNYGLVGAIEFKPGDKPGAVGTALMKQCWAEGLMVRQIVDAVAVSPPLVVEDKHIAEFQEKFRRAAETALG